MFSIIDQDAVTNQRLVTVAKYEWEWHLGRQSWKKRWPSNYKAFRNKQTEGLWDQRGFTQASKTHFLIHCVFSLCRLPSNSLDFLSLPLLFGRTCPNADQARMHRKDYDGWRLCVQSVPSCHNGWYNRMKAPFLELGQNIHKLMVRTPFWIKDKSPSIWLCLIKPYKILFCSILLVLISVLSDLLQPHRL